MYTQTEIGNQIKKFIKHGQFDTIIDTRCGDGSLLLSLVNYASRLIGYYHGEDTVLEDTLTIINRERVSEKIFFERRSVIQDVNLLSSTLYIWNLSQYEADRFEETLYPCRDKLRKLRERSTSAFLLVGGNEIFIPPLIPKEVITYCGPPYQMVSLSYTD